MEQLDLLLDRLNGGDVSAAEDVFRLYEPFLRMLVRRRLRPALRSKFDSMDVVQSVWADVLEGFQRERWRFTDRNHLQAFLARKARHRFLDDCRRNRAALKRETPLGESTPALTLAAGDPRASELAQCDELWDRVLSLCPPAHHELLRLKRMGLTVAEISQRAGLHPGSVRRILYDLAKRYADAAESAAEAVEGRSSIMDHPV